MATVKNEENARKTDFFLVLTQRNILWWVVRLDSVTRSVHIVFFSVHGSSYIEQGFPTVLTGRDHFNQNSKLHENCKINIIWEEGGETGQSVGTGGRSPNSSFLTTVILGRD